MGVTVFQNRDDYGPRRLEIAVENLGTEQLTVTSAAFRSDRFVTPALWTRPTEIAPGTTTNLRVDLPAADCETDAAASAVTIEFELPGGESGVATIAPEDPFDSIEKVLAADCAAVEVAKTVSITLADALRTEQRDDGPVALLDVEFEPTGGGEPVTIDEITRTILLRPASGEDAWPVGVTFDATSDDLTVTLEIEPSNCRLHTVTEDKVGTHLPFVSGDLDFTIPTSDAVKQELYAYIASYCGWE